MVTAEAPPQPSQSVFKRVSKLLIIALLAEIGYAVMNISTMPVYLRYDRGFGETGVGFVLVAYLFSEAIFKSPMGHLADRIGAKKLMLVGPCISVGTSVLSLVIPHQKGSPLEIILFICLRSLDGLGAAMLWPAAFAEVGGAVQDDERQQAMSFLNLCYMLGIALAFPLGGMANDYFHVRWAGLILAAILFAFAGLAVWRLVPKSVVKTRAEGSESGFKEFIASMHQIPEYLLLSVVTFAGIGFPMTIFKLFPVDQFNYSETQIGTLIGFGAIVLAIASVPMSRLGERIGRVRAVHLGMMLSSIGLWLIASGAFVKFLRQPWMLALGGIPVGIGFLLAIPAWMASVSDINPSRRGVNLGAVMTAQGLGAIIGAPIGAALYEKLQPVGIQLNLGADFGRYSPFVGCATCLTIGWLLGLRILRAPK